MISRRVGAAKGAARSPGVKRAASEWRVKHSNRL
jgi:hypothetical protein